MPNARFRAVVFTSFVPGAMWDRNWNELLGVYGIQYLIMGKEICPNTGREHIQGYVEFIGQKKMKQIKQIFGDPAIHLEPRYGSQEEAIAYCKKEGQFREYGEQRRQGQRTDLEDTYERIKVGQSLLDIAEAHPGTYIRYFKGIERLRDLMQQRAQKLEARVPPEVIVYIGKSGVGKSHACYNDTDYQDSGYKYPVQQTGKVYFDGYQGERVIWFDEFGGSVLPFHVFLRLADKWETRVETKGSSICILGLKKILISTTTYPKDWWPNSEKFREDPNQLWRRLTRVYYIPKLPGGGHAEPVLVRDPSTFGPIQADAIDTVTCPSVSTISEEEDSLILNEGEDLRPMSSISYYNVY